MVRLDFSQIGTRVRFSSLVILVSRRAETALSFFCDGFVFDCAEGKENALHDSVSGFDAPDVFLWRAVVELYHDVTFILRRIVIGIDDTDCIHKADAVAETAS